MFARSLAGGEHADDGVGLLQATGGASSGDAAIISMLGYQGNALYVKAAAQDHTHMVGDDEDPDRCVGMCTFGLDWIGLGNHVLLWDFIRSDGIGWDWLGEK